MPCYCYYDFVIVLNQLCRALYAIVYMSECLDMKKRACGLRKQVYCGDQCRANIQLSPVNFPCFQLNCYCVTLCLMEKLDWNSDTHDARIKAKKGW